MNMYFRKMLTSTTAAALCLSAAGCSSAQKADEGRQEALDIINETGSIKVHCHYCNTDHEFTLEDIEKLF